MYKYVIYIYIYIYIYIFMLIYLFTCFSMCMVFILWIYRLLFFMQSRQSDCHVRTLRGRVKTACLLDLEILHAGISPRSDMSSKCWVYNVEPTSLVDWMASVRGHGQATWLEQVASAYRSLFVCVAKKTPSNTICWHSKCFLISVDFILRGLFS